MGAQKNRLNETVLLSNHNIFFIWEIRKLFFCYALLTKGLLYYGIMQAFLHVVNICWEKNVIISIKWYVIFFYLYLWYKIIYLLRNLQLFWILLALTLNFSAILKKIDTMKLHAKSFAWK